jgi:plasmid maintenance system antidote protein VapI
LEKIYIDKRKANRKSFYKKTRRETKKMSNAQKIIKHRVQEYGITAAELARRTGLPRQRIRKAINGEAKIKGTEFLILCRALQIETF